MVPNRVAPPTPSPSQCNTTIRNYANAICHAGARGGYAFSSSDSCSNCKEDPSSKYVLWGKYRARFHRRLRNRSMSSSMVRLTNSFGQMLAELGNSRRRQPMCFSRTRLHRLSNGSNRPSTIGPRYWQRPSRCNRWIIIIHITRRAE